MSRKSCFFIGHREASEEIYPSLYAAVETHIIRYGVTEFIVGRYGCFDGLAAKAVKTAKQNHPEVELTLLLLTIQQSALFLYQMGLTALIILQAWKVYPARLPLFGQIGMWSIIPISSLPVRGIPPAMQKIFSNMQGRERARG